MTSRIIDVPALGLLSDPDDASANPAYASVRWMSILKSLSAYQTYRYRVQVNVRGPAVLRYLLHEAVFPRSVVHCLGAIGNCFAELPNPESPQRCLGRLQRFVHDAETDELAEAGLHEFVDELQKGLEELHATVSEGYFRLNQAVA